MTYLLHLKNITQLVCISNSNELFKKQENLNNVFIIENGSMIIDFNGIIVDIGLSETLNKKYETTKFIKTINCEGKSIIPGFVDAHTHALYSGDRMNEFLMKLEGKSYLDIHKAGGGIYFTVNYTRESSEEELLALLLERIQKMARLGTTTVEVKSGYGLTKDSEIKMLRVIKKAKELTNIDIVSTYCGAHSVPKGMNEDEATNEIIKNHIPTIKELIQKKEIDPEFIDVFSEKGVFERSNTKKILEAGLSIGLDANYHGDELNFIDAATLCKEVKVSAISHLEFIDEKGIDSMAATNTVAVMLPITQPLLKLPVPPIRSMIEKGVIIGLGSDFNPNTYCFNMALILNYACVNYKMKANESLVAATLNSAAALKRSDKYGSLEKGKFADFIILNTNRWENIIYQLGENLIEMVFKKGKLII